MIETLIGLGFLGLFIACFISATVLPFSSDIILVALVVAGLNYHICLVIATLGGWLGSLVNYYLGSKGKIEWIEKHSNIRREKINKITNWLQGKGTYMALFAWVPVFGNVMVIALGYLRTNIWTVNLCLIIGMFIRYLIVIVLTLQGIELVQ